MNGPRVAEHLVAEVDRAAGERAGVGCRVEDRQPAAETVGDRAAGGQLHDQVGALPQRRDRVGEPGQVQGRLRLIVADVHVDDRRTGRLALLGRGDQFVKGDRERGDGGLQRLGAGGRDGDQRPVLRGAVGWRPGGPGAGWAVDWPAAGLAAGVGFVMTRRMPPSGTGRPGAGARHCPGLAAHPARAGGLNGATVLPSRR